jgi:hypothetical protein
MMTMWGGTQRIAMGAVGFALLFGGCSKDEGVPLEKLPLESSQYICAKAYTCCSEGERQGNAFYGSSQNGCETNVRAMFTQIIPPLQAAVEKKRAVYDADALASCLSDFEGLSCADVKQGISSIACKQAVMPLVGIGGDCRMDFECIESICDGTTDRIDGKCTARKPMGMACRDDRECESRDCGSQRTCIAAASIPDTFCGTRTFLFGP